MVTDITTRPHGIFCGALQNTTPVLRAGVEQGVLGEGLEFFLGKFDAVASQLALLNTYGDGGLLRTHESLKAVVDVFKVLKGVQKTEGVRPALMQMFRTGTALVPFAYQMIDVVAAVESFEKWGQGIGRPRDQPEPAALDAWRQAQGQKAGREAHGGRNG